MHLRQFFRETPTVDADMSKKVKEGKTLKSSKENLSTG